ncbi:MAG: hypothetical protein Q8J75_07855, partial [Rhodocyclaceae bacterium]|nr:hypothetical protein [Rhodocyclaceae bacterium]
MNTLPAQEIKRRGISAVDALIETGDVHIIKNNQPQYVNHAEGYEEQDTEGARDLLEEAGYDCSGSTCTHPED